MKKRLALLGLALIFILGSVFSGAFAPMLANFVAKASSGPMHSADIANYRIENLPKKSYQVGDDVPVNSPTITTGVRYVITRQVSSRNIVVGVSHTVTPGIGGVEATQAHPAIGNSRLIGHASGFKTFMLAGSYTYHFYSEAEYAKLEFVTINGASTGMVRGAESFHSYNITVYSTNFQITLPENDKDIFPNVTIPNPSDALTDPAKVITPVTLPLPKSILDMKGRDLLLINKEIKNTDERDARREAYLPEVKATAQETGGILAGVNINGVTDNQLIEFFFEGKAAAGTALASLTPPAAITCEQIIQWIYRDLRITFYGNPTPIVRNDIRTAESRKFIPIIDGGMYYAEYYYYNEYNKITSSFRSDNITVERPVLPTGTTIQQVPGQIRLETIPEMSFVPSDGSFRIGTESTLPSASVYIHEDSKIQFDSTSELKNYTYVAVRYRPKGSTSNGRWRWLDKDQKELQVDEDDARIMRIDDYKFTPKAVGDYQFWYYTTTIFGVGSKTNIPKDRIHTFGGREFIKNQPFANISIDRDNQAPEIKWTEDFDYRPGDEWNMAPYFENIYVKDTEKFGGVAGDTTSNPAEALINTQGTRVVDTWGTTMEFEDIPDRSNWLPGSTSSSKTKIAVGESLVIPAILGEDNATASHNLDYQLFLYRYQDGIRSDDYIYWSSGLHGSDANLNGGIWNHSRTFKIPFTEESFNNSPHNNLNALLAAFRGYSVTGKYDIMIRAYDQDNNISGQYQYTFEVVDSYNSSRPRINGLFRAGQNEYQEGDTLRFSSAIFTDDFTDDRDVEVRYYLSINNGLDIVSGDAVEVKDGENGMKISGNIATVELKKDNAAGEYILNELTAVWEAGDPSMPAGANVGDKKHKGFLTFRIYAVARNYHAITRGYEVGGINPDGADFTIENITKSATATPRPPDYIVAVFDMVTIFDTTYGAAAYITDEVAGCKNCPLVGHDCDKDEDCTSSQCRYAVGGADDHTAEHTATAHSWYTNDTTDPDYKVIRQGEQIVIPALRFYYPNTTGQLYSTITYSITFDGLTRDAISYRNGSAVGGGWQGNIGDAATGFTIGNLAGNHDNQRYFNSMGVGAHYITVKVTNAGGNIAVFVGKITVVGTPHPSARLLGDSETTMRIGESIKIPAVEITIDNQKYMTGNIPQTTSGVSLQGNIVTADDHPVLKEQARVGKFTIVSGSENGSEYIVERNTFFPKAIDKYWFTYVIEITDDIEFYPVGYTFPADDATRPNYTVVTGDNIPLIVVQSLDRAAGAIRFERTWSVTVEPIQGADMIIEIEGQVYSDLANTMSGRMDSYYDKAFATTSDEWVNYYNPEEVNRYNFFTDMLVANTQDKSLEMSDSQLLGGLEPLNKSGATDVIPEHWQYGRIFLPNTISELAPEIASLGDDFNKNSNKYVTVTKGSTTLVDERLIHICDNSCPASCDKANNEDNKIQYGVNMEEGYVWFRPTGSLVANYDGGKNATEWQAAWAAENAISPISKLDWAKKNAKGKADWEPVGTSQNNFLKVDGEYVITYTIEYMGVTVTKSYKIAMGDTRAPRITLHDNSKAGDKLTKTYKVGEKFEFNTGELYITGTKDPSVFLFDKGKDSWLANSQRNSNFTITIMTHGGTILAPDDSHDYTITEAADGTETHSFYFRESGTYYLTFRITSPSGVVGTREYRLNVEEKTPKQGVAPATVWGTILIIASIGLFLGVIIYFVSTGQKTKFASAKTKSKKPSQVKENEDTDGGVV